MVQLPLKPGARALVIVAHPDDETIWMGGTIARNRAAHWTIFVLCRKSDPDRMPKFLRAARYYGAKGIICDLEDEGVMSVKESLSPIKKLLREKLPPKIWDVVFFHGANGEYGHARHKGVHQAVGSMLQRKELPAKEAYCFAHTFNEKKKIAQPKESASHAVKLSHTEWRAKRNVIKELYGFRPQSFENRSCSKVETFTSFKVHMSNDK